MVGWAMMVYLVIHPVMYTMGYHVFLLPFRLVSGLFGSSLNYFESYKNMLRENNILFVCFVFFDRRPSPETIPNRPNRIAQ